MEEKVENHPSYGLISINRVQGESDLFMSSVRTGQFIRITISRAEKRRALARDWLYPREELIEVSMSCNQFAEMITHLNHGCGTPCTINHVMLEKMPETPSNTNIRETYVKEFNAAMKTVASAGDEGVKVLKEIFDKPTVNKADRGRIMEAFEALRRKIWDSIPFIHSQFNEKMDDVVTEAKSEVESFVESKIRSLGIDALDSEIARAISAPARSPVLLEGKVEGTVDG